MKVIQGAVSNAFVQIPENRTMISKYTKYISNINEAVTWIQISDYTLESINNLLEMVQDILKSGDYWNSDTIESYIEQLQGIYDQVIDLANTKFNSVYLYGGSNSLIAPFADEVEISGGIASNVVFDLAGGASKVIIEISNLSSEMVRMLIIAAGGIEGTNSIVWDGIHDDGNLLTDGTYVFTVSATDSEGNAVAANASYRGGAKSKQVIYGENRIVTLNNDGSMFSDVLSSISQAITALKDLNYTNDLASELSDSIEQSFKRIKMEQVTLSNVTSQMTISDEILNQLRMAKLSR